jgi:hypothetical protein
MHTYIHTYIHFLRLFIAYAPNDNYKCLELRFFIVYLDYTITFQCLQYLFKFQQYLFKMNDSLLRFPNFLGPHGIRTGGPETDAMTLRP